MNAKRTVTSAPKLGDSRAWLRAEKVMLKWFERENGIALRPKTVRLEGGCRVELDGFSDAPLVLCEVYARLGKVAATTVNKACADALKLDWLRAHEFPGARIVILIANEELERRLTGPKAWRARVLKEREIEVIRAELSPAEIERLRVAERDSRLGMMRVPAEDLGARDES